MRALCGERPKELIPLAGKAAIEHCLTEALDAGIRRAAVVVRPDKPLIEEFLAGGRPAALGDWRYAGPPVDYRGLFEELCFVEQVEPVGVADAIARARRALGAEAVACLMPDNVALGPCRATVECLESYLATDLATLAALWVGASEASRLADCGRLEVEPRADGRFKVTALGEKGPGTFRVEAGRQTLRAVGRMVISARFFDLMEEAVGESAHWEMDDVPVYQAMAACGELLAATYEGRMFDLGMPQGYEAAVLAASAEPP
jgi:UTP-glucose-1-phosphate uridylyltransferase